MSSAVSFMNVLTEFRVTGVDTPCVVDPNTLNLDPNPGFWPNLDLDPDPDPGSS